MNIGLLGGSFNPCHAGHIYISEIAHRELNLDQIWWVITPLNPLKNQAELSDVAIRVSYAEKFEKPEFIKVKLLEEKGVANYSIDLLNYIISTFPKYNFIWLMGADNLSNFHKWKSCHDIINKINIAIFPRNNELHEKNILNIKYQEYYCDKENLSTFIDINPPNWTIIKMKKFNISATEIRNKKKND